MAHLHYQFLYSKGHDRVLVMYPLELQSCPAASEKQRLAANQQQKERQKGRPESNACNSFQKSSEQSSLAKGK